MRDACRTRLPDFRLQETRRVQKRKWRHRKEGVRGKAGLLGRFLYFAGLPLGALNANALATEAGDLVNGLVPPATFMVYEKITPVLRDGTLLA